MRAALLDLPSDPAYVKAAHAEIARRHATARKRRQGQFSKSQRFAAVRMRETGSVFESRHGYALPDDDAGREYLEIIAHQIRDRHPGKSVASTIAWASLRAPWCSEDEAREIAERVTAKPMRLKADELADELGVDMAERTLLKLTTIGANDCNAEERKAAHRERKAKAKAARRRAAGATPRSQYEAESVERARPWEAEGISRRTWFRRRGTGVGTAKSLGLGTHLCQVTTRQRNHDGNGSVNGAHGSVRGLRARPSRARVPAGSAPAERQAAAMRGIVRVERKKGQGRLPATSVPMLSPHFARSAERAHAQGWRTGAEDRRQAE